jgi:hypothetical protein
MKVAFLYGLGVLVHDPTPPGHGVGSNESAAVPPVCTAVRSLLIVLLVLWVVCQLGGAGHKTCPPELCETMSVSSVVSAEVIGPALRCAYQAVSVLKFHWSNAVPPPPEYLNMYKATAAVYTSLVFEGLREIL